MTVLQPHPVAPTTTELRARGLDQIAAQELIDLATQADCHLIPRDRYITALQDSLLARLRTIPCFCTTNRPELDRTNWCAKHAMIHAVTTGKDWAPTGGNQ